MHTKVDKIWKRDHSHGILSVGGRMKATHIRNKNNQEVVVERFEGNVLVVKTKKGTVIGAYGNGQQFTIRQFHQRYKPIKGQKRGS